MASEKVEEGVLRLVVVLEDSSSCMIPPPPSLLGRYNLSTLDLGSCICRNSLVFVSRLASSCNIKTVIYHGYCKNVDSFKFVCRVQLRRETHPDLTVVLFPDIPFHHFSNRS